MSASQVLQRDRLRPRLVGLTRDSLYRNAGFLFGNTMLTSAFGLVFWLLAARLYPPVDIGILSGLIAAGSLLSSMAALGLPNTIVRFYSVEQRNRDLVSTAAIAVAALAAGVAALLLVANDQLGLGWLAVSGRARMMPLLCLAAAALTASMVVDAAFVGARSSHLLLVKSVLSSAAKVLALPVLTVLGGAGLFAAYLVGVLVALGASLTLLLRRLPSRGARWFDLTLLRRRARFSLGNYVGTAFGVLPSTMLPLIVLGRLGAREAGYFAVVFLMITFLNFLPSTTSMSLLAEASTRAEPLPKLIRRALSGVYALLLPAAGALVLLSPLVLAPFGADYAREGTTCLRLLAVGSLFCAGNYIVDTVLMVLDRMQSYIVVNAANSLLVVGFAALLAGPHGLAGLATGYLLGQAVSLLLATALLGWPHRRPRRRSAPQTPRGAATP
jgi:O-antigen/teichoic acid export membrane protein